MMRHISKITAVCLLLELAAVPFVICDMQRQMADIRATVEIPPTFEFIEEHEAEAMEFIAANCTDGPRRERSLWIIEHLANGNMRQGQFLCLDNPNP